MTADGASQDGATSRPETPAPAPEPQKDQGDPRKKEAGEGSSEPTQEQDRREFRDAYNRGRNLTADGPMNFITDSTVDDMHIGDRNYYSSSFGGRAFSSGSVREDALDWVRARYVEVEENDRMREVLTERHLLVLCGSPGTGRLTTALRLLDELAAGRISRFDSGRTVDSLTEDDFEGERGYVAELAHDKGIALTEAGLDRVRDLVDKRAGFLVLISDRDDARSGSLGGYAVACPPPDREALMRRHLIEELQDEAAANSMMDRLAGDPRLRNALGPAPRPAESVRMARYLAELARGETDVEAVETKAAHLVDDQAKEWFDELAGLTSDALDEAMGLLAFRISLAVFNQSPYHLVTKLGNDLAERFIQDFSGRKAVRKSLYSNDRKSRLPACRAEIVDGDVYFGLVGIPNGLTKYTDDRMPVVLLSYLWRVHTDLGAVVVDWLEKLSEHPQSMVWVGAAQAIGLHCSFDFPSTFSSVIHPLASQEGKDAEQKRKFAAVVLDQAARDRRITEGVYERLEAWRRHGVQSQRWTAAAALGYDLGLRRIESALEELRVLGTPSEQRPVLDDWMDRTLVDVTGKSVANLLAFGEIRAVLNRLALWSTSDRQSLRELAWSSMIHLIHLFGYELDHVTRLPGRAERPRPKGRDRWPLLLVLVEEDPELAVPIAALLRWGLRRRRGDFVAKEFLGPWIRVAEKDDECLHALTRLIPLLVCDRNDEGRLLHLVRRLRSDWCDPLDNHLADALDHAISLDHRRKEAS